MESVSQLTGGFVHQINPLLGEWFGVKLWYYGLTYSLGVLGVYLWFKLAQKRLGWSERDTLDLSILVAVGVLLGGRVFEIVFYEWSYYAQHPSQAFSYWRGGMATHGILLGALAGMWVFSRTRGKSFLAIADEMAIPGAFLMGVGRIGNFIDGQILGAVTDVWWAVRFPYAEGFRHPVTLYDSLKNFLMIPLLLAVRRAWPPGRGMLLAHFVCWYGFGRFFVDLFREYPTTFFGMGTGQYFNIIMALSGLISIGCFTFMNRWLRFSRLQRGRLGTASRPEGGCVELGPWDLMPTVSPVTLWPKRFLFILLVLFPLKGSPRRTEPLPFGCSRALVRPTRIWRLAMTLRPCPTIHAPEFPEGMECSERRDLSGHAQAQAACGFTISAIARPASQSLGLRESPHPLCTALSSPVTDSVPLT